MIRFAAAAACLALTLAITPSADAQNVEPEIFTLDNGMEFLLYPRDEQPLNIAAGWVAKVGSVNERPGITGMAHFFEHMMFKGTDTIGTRDAEEDAKFRAAQREVRTRLLDLILDENYQRWREGVIDDPWDPEQFTPEMNELRRQLRGMLEEHQEEIVNNEFDEVYTKLGASGMNAFTSYDLTFYFINVPSNKFELWAWMESDRLANSVFREFYAERDVVHEERRLRTESTPTGKFQEQFDAMFWQSSPYSWPVIGWTSDLNAYTEEQAWEFYDTYYQPANLMGVVVGDFEPEEIKPVIERYFGRLSPGDGEIPPVVTLEMPQMAEKRMIAECDCQPQVEVRYHAVPFGHKDEAALGALAGILNGRTGRLYKGLVEGREIAASAFAAVDARQYGGAFSFSATTKGDATPEQLEQAWYEELEEIQEQGVPERELQKWKNQAAADSYRRLQSNFFLLVQLGYYEGLGGWEYINEHPKRQQAVTPEDVRRVANEYFDETNRAVAIYYRKEGTGQEPDDPAFQKVVDALGAERAQMVRQQARQLRSMSDVDQLRQMLTQAEAQITAAPPQFKPVAEYMMGVLRERIAELEAESGEDAASDAGDNQ